MTDPRSLIERILSDHADNVWPHVYQLLGHDPGMRDFVVLMSVDNDHSIDDPEIEVVSVSEGLRVLSECHMYDIARDVISDRMAAPDASHVLYIVLAIDRYMALSSIHFHPSMQPIGEARTMPLRRRNCVVTAVGEFDFVALVNESIGGHLESFLLTDVSECDKDLVIPGARFAWITGLYTDRIGHKSCISALRFRRPRENDKLRAVANAVAELVATLPKCGRCHAPATRAWGPGYERFCDVCGPSVREYPRATALRATIAALAALKGR